MWYSAEPESSVHGSTAAKLEGGANKRVTASAAAPPVQTVGRYCATRQGHADVVDTSDAYVHSLVNGGR